MPDPAPHDPEQYDAIAHAYRQSDVTITKDLIVRPAFLEMVGDPAGQDVVDVACGSGFSTRLVKRAGASRVLGVDISAEEVALAVEQERSERLGVDYRVADVSRVDLATLGAFDVATAVFLLPYAESREALAAMCRNVARCLRPGGRFLNVLPNPDVPVITTTAYQVSSSMELPGVEGSVRTVTYHPHDAATVSFDQFYWERSTYVDAMQAAGFRTRWVEFGVPDQARAAFGSGFWDDYDAVPHQVGLVGML